MLLRITLELLRKEALIYIYLRERDGIVGNMIHDLESEYLFDKEDNWVGVEITNLSYGRYPVKLPKLKESYIAEFKEVVELDEEKILLLFDSTCLVHRREKTSCNIDYNDVNGILGIEMLSQDGNFGVKVAKSFLKRYIRSDGGLGMVDLLVDH